MQFNAKVKFIRFSPYKLRPLVDVVRGKDVLPALQWLTTYSAKRIRPIKKLIESAVANAQNTKSVMPDQLIIKDIRVDQGPIIRYFKPGAMGRGDVQRKRLSHISVVLEDKGTKVGKK